MSAFPNLEGKVAVVTGGASGIGRGVAQALRAEGAQIVIADIERDALAATAEKLGAIGIQTDVSDAESVRSLAKEVVDQFGTAHIIVNNAGIGPLARLAEMTLDDWRWMIDVNIWGVVHGIDAFLPILQQNSEGGHIVNTASVAGLSPFPDLGAYTLTKYGIVGLTETLAIELAQDGSKVGATVMCPGTIHSNIGTSTRNRPAGSTGALHDGFDASEEDSELDMADMRWMEPLDAGNLVVDAIKAGDLYVVTHPELWGLVQERFEGIAAAYDQKVEVKA